MGGFIQARGRGSNGVFVSESCSPPSLLSCSSSSGLDRQLQRPQRRLHRREWTFDPFFDPSLMPVFTQFVFFLLDWSGWEGDPAHHASQQRRCGGPDPRGRGHQPHPGCWLVHGRPQVGVRPPGGALAARYSRPGCNRIFLPPHPAGLKRPWCTTARPEASTRSTGERSVRTS